MWKLRKRKRKIDDKISLSELVWLGFNYTCGIAFPMSFISIYYWATGGVGLHIFWVILLSAFMAFGSAWAFAKCSRMFNDGNGGAYVYVRSVFGRFWGWLIGFIQYTALPSTIIVTIVSMFRTNLDQLSIFDWAPERWRALIIDGIGVLLYLIFASSMYFGLKGFRLFINASGIIKWVSTLFVIICGIILTVRNGNVAFHDAYIGTKNLDLTVGKFNNAFSGFFYFFVGFETYIVIGKNVRNPQKNFGKGILITLGICTLFYLIVTVFIVGSIEGATWFANKDNTNYNANNYIAKEIAGIAGIIILVVCTLSLKLNGAVQNSLYAGGMIEPLAKEGYISEKLSVLNKENIAMRASTVNLIITFIACFLMLLLPDLIGSPFDFSTVLSFSTNITIIVYIFVILVICVLGYQKKAEIKIWEWILFVIVSIFLTIEFIIFNYQIIDNIATANDQGILVANIIELLMFWFFIIIAIIWYFAYYYPKYKKRLLQDPTIQQALDAEFEPLTIAESIRKIKAKKIKI